MEKPYSDKELWSAASTAGLFIGGVAVLYSLITSFIGAHSSESVALNVITAIIQVILWAAKLFGCIFLTGYFIRKFVSAHEGVTRSGAFRFGLATAILAALLYSAYFLVSALYIQPEAMEAAFNTILSSGVSSLDSNTLDAIEKIKDNFPLIGFFSNLIYCFLWGLVLSSIYSHKAVSDNPFESDAQ